MAVYSRQIGGVKGNVSTFNYESPIELISSDLYMRCSIRNSTALVSNRAGSLPLEEFNIIISAYAAG